MRLVDVVPSPPHGARSWPGAHGTVIKPPNKHHQRGEVGHSVAAGHDPACRRMVCCVGCQGVAMGMAQARVCLECVDGLWIQVTLPTLLGAVPAGGDGMTTMAYPTPVYQGLGANGQLETPDVFQWSIAQGRTVSTAYLRTLCARASAWLEEVPGVVRALRQTVFGPALLEAVTDPTRIEARTLRGTMVNASLGAGNTVPMVAADAQGVDQATIERAYTNPALLAYTRAGAGKETATGQQHDADLQQVAQIVRDWAHPIARPVGDVRHAAFDVATAAARTERDVAAAARADTTRRRPPERAAVRYFAPTVHVCTARTTLAANTLAGASGVSIASRRDGHGKVLALASATLAHATLLQSASRHRDAAIHLGFVLKVLTDEGKPMTDCGCGAAADRAGAPWRRSSPVAGIRRDLCARRVDRQRCRGILARFPPAQCGLDGAVDTIRTPQPVPCVQDGSCSRDSSRCCCS